MPIKALCNSTVRVGLTPCTLAMDGISSPANINTSDTIVTAYRAQAHERSFITLRTIRQLR
jgi:hypothetical protein